MKQILIVEDDSFLNKMLEDVYKRQGEHGTRNTDGFAHEII